MRTLEGGAPAQRLPVVLFAVSIFMVPGVLIGGSLFLFAPGLRNRVLYGLAVAVAVLVLFAELELLQPGKGMLVDSVALYAGACCAGLAFWASTVETERWLKLNAQ